MTHEQAIGIIPARYGSTRFPGKPLSLLNGAPLIQHVYEHTSRAKGLADVLVATDDERIAKTVEGFGGKVVMTSASLRSGTERIAHVARQQDAEIIVNIQGDEPLIQPSQIDQLVEYLRAHRAVPMATLMTPIVREEDVTNPHVVKVVVDRDGYALYFSRAPIPSRRQGAKGQREGTQGVAPGSLVETVGAASPVWYKHLGLYGYQRHFLLKFPTLTPTPLEQAEGLEQLRALEHGYKIQVLETAHETIGVDTPEDLQRVARYLQTAQSEKDAS